MLMFVLDVNGGKSEGTRECDMEADVEEMEADDFLEEMNYFGNYNNTSLIDDNDNDDDEICLHLLDEISVYMTTPSGGAPYLCPDCDYKTTIDVIYDDHRQSHTDYAASDCSDW